VDPVCRARDAGVAVGGGHQLCEDFAGLGGCRFRMPASTSTRWPAHSWRLRRRAGGVRCKERCGMAAVGCGPWGGHLHCSARWTDLNLINHLDVIRVALNTLPVSFTFEFGTSLLDEHPLDLLGVRHVHSVAEPH
jgi:hypothetical protein